MKTTFKTWIATTLLTALTLTACGNTTESKTTDNEKNSRKSWCRRRIQ